MGNADHEHVMSSDDGEIARQRTILQLRSGAYQITPMVVSRSPRASNRVLECRPSHFHKEYRAKTLVTL